MYKQRAQTDNRSWLCRFPLMSSVIVININRISLKNSDSNKYILLQAIAYRVSQFKKDKGNTFANFGCNILCIYETTYKLHKFIYKKVKVKKNKSKKTDLFFLKRIKVPGNLRMLKTLWYNTAFGNSTSIFFIIFSILTQKGMVPRPGPKISFVQH